MSMDLCCGAVVLPQQTEPQAPKPAVRSYPELNAARNDDRTTAQPHEVTKSHCTTARSHNRAKRGQHEVRIDRARFSVYSVWNELSFACGDSMVAGTGAILQATQPCVGCPGNSPGFLASHWIGNWGFFSSSFSTGRNELPGILLSGNHDSDHSLHSHFFQHLRH